ncbi:uncharacterized protein LOC131306828 [Rhododendron vialii]|uniref:uncharacterized protein LOC131306828 n=1 Tax=Rhododendron vialii TaxID=182163 RepID=UPI00265DCC7C|nr:uncharacterized protein LOC131306828 [Rhododendron vialii]
MKKRMTRKKANPVSRKAKIGGTIAKHLQRGRPTNKRKFKMPQLETFNGSTDPLDHLETYKSLMHLQALLDEVMCRAFPVTLKGSARAWFNKLPPRSIHSFKELSTSFISYFITGQRYGKPATHFLTVKEGRWESLRDYNTRFNKEVVQIDAVDDNVSITAYIAGLYLGQFLYLLSQEPPKTLAELMLRAQKHMNVEEAIYARRLHDSFDPRAGPSQVGKFPPLDKRRREATSKTGGKPKNKKVDSRSSPKRGGAGGPPQGRVEDKSKEGRDGTTPCSGPIGEIKVIHGGFAGGGESSNARKAHLRKLRTEEHLEVNTVGCPSKLQKKEEIPIIFSEEDIKGVQISHDDPLIITIVVANYLTRRVLIDNRSSVDILYLHAYDQLKIGRGRLKPMTSPPVGFVSTPTYPIGQIALPVTMGEEGRQITCMIDFIVVDCPSAYNAILGRITLNKIGAIISTYHLMIKFPTPEGIGCIRGDQKAARECYITSLRGANITMNIESLDTRDEEKLQHGEPVEELIKEPLEPGQQERNWNGIEHIDTSGATTIPKKE